MNEEVKYCNQCGVKITPEAKFCSSCGHDLINSSTKTTLDKTIKVEVTNATVEKGFKAAEKGIKATGKGLLSSLTPLDKTTSPYKGTLLDKTIDKIIKLWVILLKIAVILIILSGVGNVVSHVSQLLE